MAAIKLELSALVLLVLVALPAYSYSSAAGGNVHEEITRQALHDTITDANLNFMIKAINSQNAPGSEGESEARRHFSDTSFGAAISYMDREKKQALNYAGSADTDAGDRAQVLRHLGLMLHTAQDFYSHTNYIELMLEDPKKSADPLGMDLVDWSRVPDGYAGKSSGAPLTAAGPAPAAKSGPGAAQAAGTNDISKDNPNTPQSKKKAGGLTYFDISKDLATRETQRQWNLFEALVRGRYHERAPAIVDALRKSALSADASPDSPDMPDID